jgi:hypothetical protein
LFAGYSDTEFDEMDGALTKLRERISQAGRPSSLSHQQKEES